MSCPDKFSDPTGAAAVLAVRPIVAIAPGQVLDSTRSLPGALQVVHG
jgi:hypothetical protein